MKKQKNAPQILPREEWPYEVPENWIWTNLQSICAIPITDGTHKTPTYCDAKDGFPFISSKDVTDQHINWNNIKYITPELHNELYARLAPQIDDILLAKNGTTGVAALVETDQIFDIYVTLAVIRPNQIIINPKYIFHLVNSPLCKQQFNEHLTGIGLPNLHLRDIKATMIPLPPLPEQQRIVARIESLFAKLDAAAEKIRATLDIFPTRKAALLHKAFTGELTKKWREEHGVRIESWARTSIGKICKVVRGGSPRPAGSPKYYGGTIPFMKVADITRNKSPFVSSTEFTIKEAGLSKTRLVNENTLLLTNSGATLGVPAICTIQTTFNDGIAAFLDLEPNETKFLYYFWISMTQRLRNINQGAAQPNLNIDIIKSVRITLPSVIEQQEIVRRLDAIFAREQTAKETAERLLTRITLTKKSILARAFRGLLGTNDPTEESAEGLLRDEPA